jgi:hypothetical protein
MKNITLSDLTKKDILSLKKHNPLAVEKTILCIDNNDDLYQSVLQIESEVREALNKDAFEYILGIKKCLNLVDKAIQRYRKDHRNFYLDDNDRVWLSNLYLTNILFYIQ